MTEGIQMPEFTVKEVRLPELHLPEIKREEIVRSLSGVRLPDVDLAKARRASLRVPAVSVTGADVGRMLATAATVARLVRPTPGRNTWLAGRFSRRSRSPLTRIVQPRRRRSRWPIAIGGMIVLALLASAILRRPEVRRRLDSAARGARRRLDELRREDGNETLAIELYEPVDLAAPDETAAGIDEDATEVERPGSPALEDAGTPA